MLGIITLLIGYGSFAVIVIRSNANTPLDENDPENLVTLKAFKKRQYGSRHLVANTLIQNIVSPSRGATNRKPISDGCSYG